jgi:hypothetical protein
MPRFTGNGQPQQGCESPASHELLGSRAHCYHSRSTDDINPCPYCSSRGSGGGSSGIEDGGHTMSWPTVAFRECGSQAKGRLLHLLAYHKLLPTSQHITQGAKNSRK